MVVVGGGIAGCSVALALRERGSPVTLIQPPRSGGAATPASAGIIAPQYESDAADPTFWLGVESRSRYPDYLAGVNALAGSDVRLEGGGMLVANHTGAEHEAAGAAASAQRALGLEVEVLDAPEAARLEPSVAPEVRSFLWFAEAFRVDCGHYAAALVRATKAAGARLVSGRAVGLQRESGRVHGVKLEDGSVATGDGVVLAAGCWSGQIAGLPDRVPVRPVRGQILRLASDALPTGPVLADHAGRYLVPRAGGALAGSTMDEVGFEAEVTEAGNDAIRRAVGRLCPAASGAVAAEEWAGLRPVSDDGVPIIGPDPGLGGLFYATGYGRSGILLAPILAETVSDLALGLETGAGWDALAIERFSQPGTRGPRTSA